MRAPTEWQVINDKWYYECGYGREEEGAHSDLIDYGCRKKYTHHPIAAAQEYAGLRVFRHVLPEQLAKAASEHGVYRQARNFWLGIDVPEVDPLATISNVGMAVGIQCLLCPAMVSEPIPLNKYGYFDHEIEDAFIKLCKVQSVLSHGLIGYYDFPCLCAKCWQAADWGNNRHYWGTKTVRALRSILLSMLPAHQEKRRPCKVQKLDPRQLSR